MKKQFLVLSTLLITTLTASVDCTQSYKVQSFVERFYTEVLERSAESTGLDGWTNKLASGTRTGADVASGFMLSDEFVAKNKNDENFVKILYKAFFNREADEAGLAEWLEQLSLNVTRQDVLNGFLGSQEFVNLSNEYGIKAYEGATFTSPSLNNFVKRFYSIVLGRVASDVEVKGWTDKLSTGTATGADIAVGFVFSPEYNEASKDNSTYVNTLYAAFFDRPADSAGFNGWMTNLSAGMSRQEVLDSFLHSQEFINLSSSFNILAFTGAPEAATVPNISPIAVAGADDISLLGEDVLLDGTNSTDADGTIECYWWATEFGLITNTATFTATDVEIGVHTVRLTVVDNKGISHSDSKVNTVIEDTTTPIANAGTNQIVDEGDTVHLDASGSSDNNSTLQYTWVLSSKPSGSKATLSNANTKIPEFVADKIGNYRVSLVANDAQHSSSSVSVDIRAKGYRVVNKTRDTGADGSLDYNLSYSYDASGNQLRGEDFFAGINFVYIYTYDGESRVLTKESQENDVNITKKVYEYNDITGNLSILRGYDGALFKILRYVTTYSYDVNNNNIAYEIDGDYVGTFPVDGIVDSNRTYIYDDNNNLLSDTYDRNANGVIDFIYIYTYDSHNNLLTESYDRDGDGNANSITIYTYDENNNRLTRSIDTDANGVVDTILTHTYDENGNEIIYGYDTNGDGILESIIRYEYNVNQDQIKSNYDLANDGTIDTIKTYTYDSNHNKIISAFDSDADGNNDIVYTYTWIEL